MILCVSGDGPLAAALVARFREQGEEARVASPSDDDLFGKALGCRCIVYLPAPTLLEGRLHPGPAPERMRKVLGATNAPGVRLLIVATPPGYDDEELALRKYGIPYVILRTPPLVEELEALPALHEPCAVWLPRGRKVAVTSATLAADAIVRASRDDSLQGATVDAPHESVDAAQVLRQAAARARRASVHTVAPALDRVVRRVGRFFRVPEPPIVALHGQLGGS
jgi:hypothetical protein